jgi:hypothetical protein
VPAFRIAKALAVIEHGLGVIPSAIQVARSPIAVLSETLPDRLIEADDAVIGHEPLELLAGVLAAAIGVMSSASSLPHRQIVITSASVTSCAVKRCTNRPADNAPGKDRRPRPRRASLLSSKHMSGAIHLQLGTDVSKVESTIEHVWSDGGRLPCRMDTQVLRGLHIRNAAAAQPQA